MARPNALAQRLQFLDRTYRNVPTPFGLGGNMFNWAVIFFIIAIVAGVLGLGGVAGTAAHIAWILFVVGIILAIVFFVMGRRPRL